MRFSKGDLELTPEKPNPPSPPCQGGRGIMSEYVIRKKSRLWKILPGGRNKFSATLGDTIYLTPERYDDWQGGSPKGSTIALVEHEKVHVQQYWRDPGFKRKYLTSRKWRLRYEAEAYAKQAFIRVRLDKRKRGRAFFVDRYARVLASNTYLLFKGFDEVYDAIDREYGKLAGHT